MTADRNKETDPINSKKKAPKNQSGNRSSQKLKQTPPFFDPRKMALKVLNAINKNDLPLDYHLNHHFESLKGINRKDINLSHNLIFGVLRWQIKIDWMISRVSKTPLSKINGKVLNILRLGVYQIFFLDRIPNSAAVNNAVMLSKTLKAPWISGFVNGILRNIIRRKDDLTFPDPKKDPIKALSTEKSFPAWMTHRWVNRFGVEKTSAMMDAINTPPPMTFRTNTLHVTREILIESLSPFAKQVEKTAYSPEGIFITGLNSSIDTLPPFSSGWFQVQDEAAQSIAHFLNPNKGEVILDACAGLGTKTAHLAQLMKNTGQIIAMDLVKSKIVQLNKEMERLGITNVKGIPYDINLPFTNKIPSRYDKILLDAPCSGLGVLRRNPDAKARKDEKEINRCARRQLLFLSNLSGYLKVNGTLTYTVCSFEPEETKNVVITFLKNHPEFAIENEVGRHHFLNPFISDHGYLETFPSEHHMDGFFSVVLKRLY